MSTKIYNAYEAEFSSIEDMHQKMNSIRPKIKEVLKLRAEHRVIEDWIQYVDDATMKGEPIKKYFWDICNEARVKFKEIKTNDKRNINYDFYFEAVVMPYKGKQYIKIFCEGTYFSLCNLFEEFAKDFYYQNSTDKPKEISQKEWDHRSEVWDAIFSNSLVWIENGFLYDYSLNDIADFPFFIGKLKDKFPTKELRAKRIARIQIWEEKYKSEKINVELIHKINDYIKSSEGKKDVEKRCKKIMPKLIDDIAQMDLKNIDKNITNTPNRKKKGSKEYNKDITKQEVEHDNKIE
jgi:hypothetical protein